MTKSLRLCAAFALLFGSLAVAQTITGTITGTVTDPSGSIVPNAKITGTNTGTSLDFTAQTNSAGLFNLLFLPVGNYTLSVEAPGFRRSVLGPFPLEVAQVARIDVKLEVGDLTQTVQITDVAPILQTETAQTGEVITGSQASALPINSRNVVQLTLLAPGVVTPNPGGMVAFNGGSRPYTNGNREQTNNFLLDGMDINETIDNGVAYHPNVDALEEVKVFTGNAAAEFGNANGSVVTMNLKSGTNQIHGNAFEFLRNDKFDANSFFNNRSGAAKRNLRQNVFGGTLGGPVVKDKIFFFMDYQGARQINSGPSLLSVASPAMRTGNLSSISAPIKDPTLAGICSATDRTACFPGNIIPQSRIVNPAALALFANTQLYPLPTNAGTGAIGVTNDFRGATRNTQQADQADVKIDYRLSAKDNLSGRFTISRFTSVTGATAAFQVGSASNNPTTGGVINWIRTISPTVVNEARLGYNRPVVIGQTTDPFGILGAGGNGKLGIPGGQPIAGASAIAPGDGLTQIGGGASDSSTYDNNYLYGDNLSWMHGRHTIKMGFQFMRYQQNRFYAGNNGLLGIFTYDGTYSSDSYADFLLDQLHVKGRGSQTGTWGHRQWRDGIFFQDDYKVRANLTVNLGMRWEYTQPVYEVLDREANFNLQNGTEIFAGKNGASRALYNSYWKQFMPRIGFAWTPTALNNKFVVRGAFGITSYMEGTGANLRLPLNPPFFYESNVTYDSTAPGSIKTGFTDTIPGNTPSGQVRAWNPDLRPAFIEQWNFTMEYMLSQTLSINAGYVGQKGTHLVDPREYNQPLPGVGPVANWTPLQTRRPLYPYVPLITTISGTDSSAKMFYSGLQSGLRKRFSHGLEFQASYTYSKTLTDNLGYYGSSGVNAAGAYWQNAYDRRGDWGRSFFDATHVFSMGGYYDLPFGKTRALGKTWGKAADAVLGGWTSNYAMSLHSGFPITLQSTGTAGGQLARGTMRPNRYKSGFDYANQNIDHWFGTSAPVCLTAGVNDGSCVYGVPDNALFGNASPSTEFAPAYKNFDLGIGKKFVITERKYFEFRSEFFNVLNHTSFGPPARNITAPATFGAITTTISNPRNIEFGLKFFF